MTTAPAAPQAVGYGASVTGARRSIDSKVYEVISLEDSGPGTLREACEAEGPRYVIFSVAGLITVRDRIEIEHGDITILGQTAPGGGITITRPRENGRPLIAIKAPNVNLQYIRLRGTAHPNNPGHSGDCIQINEEAKGVYIANCSLSGFTDEGLDSFPGPRRVTIQDCIFSHGIMTSHEKDRPHGYATILGGKDGNGSITFARNLIVHAMSRVPKINPGSDEHAIEVLANAIINPIWRAKGWGGSHVRSKFSRARVNYVDNYVRIGEDAEGAVGSYISSSSENEIYEAGTLIISLAGADVTNTDGATIFRAGDEANVRVSDPHHTDHGHKLTTSGASSALQYALANAGCTIYRDHTDQLAIEQAQSGRGRWIDDEREIGGVEEPPPGEPWEWFEETMLPAWFVEETGAKHFTAIEPETGYSYGEVWAQYLSHQTPPEETITERLIRQNKELQAALDHASECNQELVDGMARLIDDYEIATT